MLGLYSEIKQARQRQIDISNSRNRDRFHATGEFIQLVFGEC
jgi:hypothetical protein